MRYVAPAHLTSAFTCPHCGTLAQFNEAGRFAPPPAAHRAMDGMQVHYGHARRCQICDEFVVFYKGELVYPSSGLAPPASEDMPDAVRAIYAEAAAISAASPRAASALLRLAVETLISDLVGGGKRLNDAIASLVREKRIHERQQEALDVVRVTGNDAIHGREISDDGAEMCQALFRLVNWLVQTTITEDEQVAGLFAALPEEKREQIRQRDGTPAEE